MPPSKRNPVPRWAGRASRRNFAASNFRLVDRLLPSDHQQIRRRDLNAEARVQAAIVDWIRTVAPSILVFSVPNGGLRTKAEAARLKWTGALAGVPDLAIVAPGGRVHFLEVKTPTSRLSSDQRTVHDALVALGTAPAIVRSIDDVRRAFAAWGLSTREVLP
jgi:hypothetical protein